MPEGRVNEEQVRKRGQGMKTPGALLSTDSPSPTPEQPSEPDHLVKYYFSPN